MNDHDGVGDEPTVLGIIGMIVAVALVFGLLWLLLPQNDGHEVDR